jgi:hypothetical protein
MSGDGPGDRQVTGEKAVEGGQNPEGGPCRVRQTRVIRTLPLTSLEGRRNPRRGSQDHRNGPDRRCG